MKFEGSSQLEQSTPEDESKKVKKQHKIEKSANISIESARTEKEKKLRTIRSEVDNYGDRLGEGVDEGIKETVSVYNAIGLPTSASCEGHFEGNESKHGFPVPWVEVGASNEPQWRFEREEQIYGQIAKKYGVTVDKVLHADNNEAWKEAVQLSVGQQETAEYKAWEEENERLFVKMESLLQEFYKGRDVADEFRLIADKKAGGFRVHNGGKFYIPNNKKERLQKELTEEERNRIPEVLKGSQQEMRIFTEFLKEKYFRESKEVRRSPETEDDNTKRS